MADDWRTPDTDALVDAILRLDDARRRRSGSCATCARSASSTTWRSAGRWSGSSTPACTTPRSRRGPGASTATITRIASWLHHGEGGYRRHARRSVSRAATAIDPLPARRRAMRERLRLAVPNKGRLLDADADAARTTPASCSRRTTAASSRASRTTRWTSCSCARTTSSSSSTTASRTSGITGGDILAESGVDLPVAARAGLRPLPARGRGARRTRRTRRSPTSAAPRVATSHPNVDPPVLRRARAIAVEVVPLSGAVEVAPRLGRRRRDRGPRVDRLDARDERPAADRRPARLRGGPASPARRLASPRTPTSSTRIVTMLGSVIAARGRKYLMMNAPATASTELEELLPGLESPSVIPLAHAGMIAIHSVVGADEVWGLLPRLKARRRVGDPRPADREDPPVTAPRAPRRPHGSRRLDLRAPDAAAAARARRPVPPRRRARPAGARGGPRDPRRRPRARRRRRPRRRRALRRRAAGRPAPARPRDELARRRRRARARRAIRPRDRDRERHAGSPRPSARRHRPAPRSSTGVELERRWLPVGRVGVYAPGGSAPYPSSLVMGVVPARVAGVDADRGRAARRTRPGTSTRCCSAPPACSGVDALLVAGGVQAIGALAYGLPDEGLDPVDLVVGPGSAWVTAAKVEIVGEVGIDLPAGPSEGLVLADANADPVTVAADLADPGRARPRLPRPARDAGRGARRRGRGRGPPPPRDGRAAATSSPAPSPTTAGSCSSRTSRPGSPSSTATARSTSVDRRRGPRGRPSTGSATRARSSSAAGRPESRRRLRLGREPRAARPAASRARCGPLAVETFGKFNQVQRITREGLAALRPAIRTLAEAEGLLAHRDAVEARFDDERRRRPAAQEAAR